MRKRNKMPPDCDVSILLTIGVIAMIALGIAFLFGTLLIMVLG
jgi:hypothetical protein